MSSSSIQVAEKKKKHCIYFYNNIYIYSYIKFQNFEIHAGFISTGFNISHIYVHKYDWRITDGIMIDDTLT